MGKKRNKLVEKLAAIEHEQWVAWSKSLIQSEQLTEGRVERWKKLWVPYSELTEDMKDEDRKWAEKVYSIVATSQPSIRLLKWWLLFNAVLATILVISWAANTLC